MWTSPWDFTITQNATQNSSRRFSRLHWLPEEGVDHLQQKHTGTTEQNLQTLFCYVEGYWENQGWRCSLVQWGHQGRRCSSAVLNNVLASTPPVHPASSSCSAKRNKALCLWGGSRGALKEGVAHCEGGSGEALLNWRDGGLLSLACKHQWASAAVCCGHLG